MAIMMSDLRSALINAGADEEHADKAAIEVASYEARLSSIDSRLSVVTWMAGAGTTLGLMSLGGIAAVWERLGEITDRLAHLAP